jgi:hypothetical protein
MCIFFPALLCCLYSVALTVPQPLGDSLYYYRALRYPFETAISLFFTVSAAVLGYVCQRNVIKDVNRHRNYLQEATLADTKLIIRSMWVTLGVEFLFNSVQLIPRMIQNLTNICYYFYPDSTVGFCSMELFNYNDDLLYNIGNIIWWCITALLYAKPAIDGLVTAYFCLPYRRGIAELFGSKKVHGVSQNNRTITVVPKP